MHFINQCRLDLARWISLDPKICKREMFKVISILRFHYLLWLCALVTESLQALTAIWKNSSCYDRDKSSLGLWITSTYLNFDDKQSNQISHTLDELLQHFRKIRISTKLQEHFQKWRVFCLIQFLHDLITLGI